MAQTKERDYQYIKCRNEAVSVVQDWYNKNNIIVDPATIYVTWFAYTKHGYMCMVTSKMCKDMFFEIIKNIKSGETICHILQQVECTVKPSSTETFMLMASRVDILA